MHQRPSRKKQLTKRVIIYMIMTISVVTVVTLLIFLIMGYRFDADNGRVEQGALMQFASTPSGATVTVDAKVLSTRTPAKNTILAGVHTFGMERDGYTSWTKTLDIKPGTLTWLNYARLVPKDLPVTTIADYTTLTSNLASPSGRDMLLQTDASKAEFQLANLRDDEVKSIALTFPANLVSEATTANIVHLFKLVHWDSDGRYVLIQHTYADKNEWLILDTKDVASSKNITTTLNVEASQIQFAGTNGTSFFALVGADVRKLDLAGGTISKSLVANVASFSLYSTNIITYVSTPDPTTTRRTVGIYKDGDATHHVLKTITSDPTARVSVVTARYINQDYVAISEDKTVEVWGGSYPTGSETDSLKKLVTFSNDSPVTQLSFSLSGNYVLAQSGVMLASYSVEYQLLSQSKLPASTTPATAQWLDGHYTWSDTDGTLTMREFDGTNSHDIMKVAPGYDANLSANGRYIYSIGKTEMGYQLQRVRMILN